MTEHDQRIRRRAGSSGSSARCQRPFSGEVRQLFLIILISLLISSTHRNRDQLANCQRACRAHAYSDKHGFEAWAAQSQRRSKCERLRQDELKCAERRARALAEEQEEIAEEEAERQREEDQEREERRRQQRERRALALSCGTDSAALAGGEPRSCSSIHDDEDK